jgi:hypothetical protein
MTQLLREIGIEPGEDVPVFGMAHDPRVALRSARVIFSADAFVARVIGPALCAAGRDELVTEIWTAYSFRRGGINFVYQQAVAQGTKGLDLLALLMKTGRWQSVASLAVYLVELDSELASLLKLMCSRGGRMAVLGSTGAEVAAELTQTEPATRGRRRRGAAEISERDRGRLAELWARQGPRTTPVGATVEGT